jgi:hypothetical protein
MGVRRDGKAKNDDENDNNNNNNNVIDPYSVNTSDLRSSAL